MQEHYASDQIKERSDGVDQRLQKIKTLSSERHSKLTQSLQFQQFLANTHEVISN